MEFKKLGLSDELLKSLREMGFTQPTDIQKKTIPLALQGKDIIAGSETGSGKTLAFGAGIIQDSQRKKSIQALILTPTRELAEQIVKAMRGFAKYKPLKMTAIYGGVSINPQFEALKVADIVVGTPGRILDHIERNSINLSNVKHLVLDEADRMLDMGFLDDVSKIMRQCPKQRQMLLFSATIPSEIVHLSKKFMNNPIKVDSNSYVDPKKLKQVYYDVKNSIKFSMLVHLLKEEKGSLVMVFCNSRHYTDVVAKNLKKTGIDAMSIHGGLSQARRLQVLDKFNSKTTFVLVCTDVAARGLDIPGVSHVYNYEIPHDSKQYIHRIGRTARAGKNGIVINLISDRDHENFSKVLQDHDVFVERREKPEVKKVEMSRVQTESSNSGRHTRERSPRGGRSFGRGSSRSGGGRGRFSSRSSSPKKPYSKGRTGSGRPSNRSSRNSNASNSRNRSSQR